MSTRSRGGAGCMWGVYREGRRKRGGVRERFPRPSNKPCVCLRTFQQRAVEQTPLPLPWGRPAAEVLGSSGIWGKALSLAGSWCGISQLILRFGPSHARRRAGLRFQTQNPLPFCPTCPGQPRWPQRTLTTQKESGGNRGGGRFLVHSAPHSPPTAQGRPPSTPCRNPPPHLLEGPPLCLGLFCPVSTSSPVILPRVSVPGMWLLGPHPFLSR